MTIITTVTKMYLIYTMLPPEIRPLNKLYPEYALNCFYLINSSLLLNLLILVASLGKSQPHQDKYLVMFLKENKNT